MAVSGECALCKKESELKLSHIIPKFVFRTLKKDSFTGRFRTATEPNKALQDGKKEYMLCGECEGLFSSNETKFSNKIFIPFKENGFKTPLKYDDNWLNFFITSVNWRVLYLDIQKEENKKNPQLTDVLNKMKQSEDIMRAFLLGNRYNLDRIENHIFFFDVAESASGFERPNSLFLGTVFANTIILGNAEEKFIYIVSNLSGVLIITIIKKYQKDKWYNTFVKNESGKVKPPQKMESILGQEFSNLQKLREQYKQGLSPNQKKQIEEKIKNDPEGFMRSGTYKRIMLDLNLK